MEPQEQPQGGPAAAAALEQLKQRACESVDLNAARLGALSRDIWSRPELAYAEHQAHDALTRFFSSGDLPGAAWSVRPRYLLDTAFRADWGTAAPRDPLRVAFLCEYDALPGLGHACGHNLIAEVGAAAALALKAALESLAQPVAVQISVLGTPAEEQGGGKIDLIKAGAFEGLDVVFMAHPSQENAAYLPDVAEHDVTVKYYGKASHAAAYPWEGVNALDAAVLAYNNLSVLRQQMKPTWRVHGYLDGVLIILILNEAICSCAVQDAQIPDIRRISPSYYSIGNKAHNDEFWCLKCKCRKFKIEGVIKNGGVKPNIIPSYTELEFYLRAPSMKELSVLTEKVENCFKSAALATGCKVEIKGGENDYYNVLPNKSLQKIYKENGKKLGIEFISEDAILNGLSGSTDFGNVTFVVPGLHPYFYIGSDALNHTEQYTEAAGSQTAQFYALRTAKALAMTALDVIFKPRLLEEVRKDFREVKLKEEGQINPAEPKKESGVGVGPCASH